jgi:iron(III) transport system substrate-binding protein
VTQKTRDRRTFRVRKKATENRGETLMENLKVAIVQKCCPDTKRWLSLFTFAFALFANVAEIPAQQTKLSATERQRNLEALAKKEGRVIFYGVTGAAETTKLVAAFRERYPQITVDNYRAGGAALTSKILTEFRAGKMADVIILNPTPAWVLIDRGLVNPYSSPALEAVRDEFRSPTNLWVVMSHYLLVTGYNTRSLAKESLPGSYQDLLNKKWTKQIGIDQTDWDWFQVLANSWGERNAVDFLQGLMSLQPNVRRGHTLQAQLLAAGEFSISSVLYDYRVKQMKLQGAPIDGIVLPPAVVQPDIVLQAKGGPHPNAAALLMDWLLSREAQTLVEQDFRRNSARKDLGKEFDQWIKGKPMQVMTPEKLGPKSDHFIDLYKKIVGS